jgi:hypothetical protein
MLDWYFDCDDDQHSLRELLKPSSVSQVTGKAEAGDGAEVTSLKLERYAKADKPDDGESSCYVLFHIFLNDFLGIIRRLFEKYCGDDIPGSFNESMIWIRADEYAVDTWPHKVWLGLGRLENGVRKPVTFRAIDDCKIARLPQLKRKLESGRFIASAELVEVFPRNSDQEALQRELYRQGSPCRREMLVLEAGVCSLEQLFVRNLTGNEKNERNTKAHRMLVRDILLTMALAVLQLHECSLAHDNIALRFFKVFLVDERSRSTNLRVKLVASHRFYDHLTPVLEREDIEDLGKAMARLVLGEISNVEELSSYDPQLHRLVTWMLDDSIRPTLADVIRHPYFMSLNWK